MFGCVLLAAMHFSVPSILTEKKIALQLPPSLMFNSFVLPPFTIYLYMYMNNVIKYVPTRQ